MNENESEVCRGCFTSIEDCINSRRCFMTGEYCSKQTNIQKERMKLHDDECINAFVVMNFSNMSDVVYKWRLKRFIESIKKYLYIDKAEKKLYCLPSAKLNQGEMKKKWTQVKEVKVIRADSNPASNYVICNRVCQQMQIADLIIVDVSAENTNVFYEFGMAVAMEKLILPICYSESFFEMVLPNIASEKNNIVESYKHIGSEGISKRILERHIGCYPWRKKLFEYYGIRYRSEKFKDKKDDLDKIQYLDFEIVVNERYGFSDAQYNHFPYHEIIDEGKRGHKRRKIGEIIYSRLQKTYNKAKYEHNTLVVYTMDGFLNEHQAGLCIINYYKNMTKKMKEEHCFCGDRVGVLVQENIIPEDVKDAKAARKLIYSVGEIIHIGMNQATYIAQKEKIKTQDFLSITDENTLTKLKEEDKRWQDDVVVFVKEYIRNRSMLIYPNNPVYVNRIKNGLQSDILKVNASNKRTQGNEMGNDTLKYYFCLFHVMLRTLKYTNEIVVDISKNSLQSLFWLGAAHGADVYAITVQHEENDKEKAVTAALNAKPERPIFDVAGLWTAILRSSDTEGFYRQLALAQLGIEQHTKLMLKNVDTYEEKLLEHLYKTKADKMRDTVEKNASFTQAKLSTPEEIYALKEIVGIIEEKELKEAQALESYYRDCFWKPMLRYNRLWIYLPQMDIRDDEDGEPRMHTVKWDVDAIAVLSHYLSKRKIIGEYHFKTLPKEKGDLHAESENFICVGDAARPLQKKEEFEVGVDETESLAEYIHHKIQEKDENLLYKKNGYNVIHQRWQIDSYMNCEKNNKLVYKGFSSFGYIHKNSIFTQVPQTTCMECNIYKSGDQYPSAQEQEICKEEEIDQRMCSLKKDAPHVQLAQLILWREVSSNPGEKVNYRVALTGASGPATLALSSILVSEDQKDEVINQLDKKGGNSACDGEGQYLLSKLQANVRSKFTGLYFEKLDEKLNKLSIITKCDNKIQSENLKDPEDQKKKILSAGQVCCRGVS